MSQYPFSEFVCLFLCHIMAVCIYDLFKDADGSSGCIEKSRMTDEFELEKLSKEVVATQFEVLSHSVFEKNTVNLNQVSRCLVWCLKPRPNEYKNDLIPLTETFRSFCIDCKSSVLS